MSFEHLFLFTVHLYCFSVAVPEPMAVHLARRGWGALIHCRLFYFLNDRNVCGFLLNLDLNHGQLPHLAPCLHQNDAGDII